MDPLVRMPDSFAAGTTVSYTKFLDGFAPADGWSLVVYLNGASAANVSATVVAGAFVVTFAASATAGLVPGTYAWVERVTKGSEVHDAGRGTVIVAVNMATAPAGTGQSWNEKTLAALETAITARLAGGTVDDYQIGTRSVRKMPLTELMKQRDIYRARVNAGQNPGQVGQPVLVRFPRPSFDLDAFRTNAQDDR